MELVVNGTPPNIDGFVEAACPNTDELAVELLPPKMDLEESIPPNRDPVAEGEPPNREPTLGPPKRDEDAVLSAGEKTLATPVLLLCSGLGIPPKILPDGADPKESVAVEPDEAESDPNRGLLEKPLAELDPNTDFSEEADVDKDSGKKSFKTFPGMVSYKRQDFFITLSRTNA